jgi:hypothetical protein
VDDWICRWYMSSRENRSNRRIQILSTRMGKVIDREIGMVTKPLQGFTGGGSTVNNPAPGPTLFFRWCTCRGRSRPCSNRS